MGAWGTGTFENDTACDWESVLTGKRDLAPVAKTLAQVLAGGDDIEADLGCEALAACEVIARLQGRWGTRDPYSETVDQWVDANPQVPSTDLVEQAVIVIDMVLGTGSELASLWEDSDDEWRAAVADLRARVTG